MTVQLSGSGITKGFFVHVLVAKAFLEAIPGKTKVNHIDEIKDHNHVDNLEWVTNAENMWAHNANPERKTGQKAVIMYNLNGKELKRYDKMRNAANDNTRDPQFIDASSITRVCKGKQGNAGGFLFSYV